MSSIRKMYNFVVFFQMIMLFLFIILNINSLDNITYQIIINEETYDFEFSFYTMLIIVSIILTVSILASLSLFGSGLNDEGTRSITKLMSIFSLLFILNVGSAYFLTAIGLIGVIMLLFMDVVFIINTIESMAGQDMEVE